MEKVADLALLFADPFPGVFIRLFCFTITARMAQVSRILLPVVHNSMATGGDF